MSARTSLSLFCMLALTACDPDVPAPEIPQRSALEAHVDAQLKQYATVRLAADLGSLTAGERAMLPLMIRAAGIMDGLYWQQAYGDGEALLRSIADPATRRFATMNYGPWDRLDDNRPFVAGVGPKPPGANFYPADMTDAEFDALADLDKSGLYSILRRTAAGTLQVQPYRVVYAQPLAEAAALLRQAAALAEDQGLRRYLELRATALVTDDYHLSDFAWLAMKNNRVDLVIGPIEVYEDKRYNYKAAFEAYVLIKDRTWSARLARNAALLPELQRALPVPAAYKRESPGTSSDLNAYDVVFYAGDANAGAKTIAINLPNDEEVQLKSGTRRLQLKNAMQAKFERIVVPIADQLVAPDQRGHIKCFTRWPTGSASSAR
jgi:Peptidase family M49